MKAVCGLATRWQSFFDADSAGLCNKAGEMCAAISAAHADGFQKLVLPELLKKGITPLAMKIPDGNAGSVLSVQLPAKKPATAAVPARCHVGGGRAAAVAILLAGPIC